MKLTKIYFVSCLNSGSRQTVRLQVRLCRVGPGHAAPRSDRPDGRVQVPGSGRHRWINGRPPRPVPSAGLPPSPAPLCCLGRSRRGRQPFQFDEHEGSASPQTSSDCVVDDVINDGGRSVAAHVAVFRAVAVGGGILEPPRSGRRAVGAPRDRVRVAARFAHSAVVLPRTSGAVAPSRDLAPRTATLRSLLVNVY